MTLRIGEAGESEGRPVIGRIGAASDIARRESLRQSLVGSPAISPGELVGIVQKCEPEPLAVGASQNLNRALPASRHFCIYMPLDSAFLPRKFWQKMPPHRQYKVRAVEKIDFRSIQEGKNGGR